MRLRKFPKAADQPEPIHFQACVYTFPCANLLFICSFVACVLSVNRRYFFLFNFRNTWDLILSYMPGERNEIPNRCAETDKL